MSARSVVALAAAFCALAQPAVAQQAAASGGVVVLASNGMKSVMEGIEDLEAAVGRPLTIDFGTTAAQRQKIESNAAFDVAVLATESVEALASAGKIASDSVAPLGRSGIAVGVRKGAPKPEIATPDALKRALLAAKSVTWVGVGAARPHIERMLATLAIADEVQRKVVPANGVDESLANVAEGRAEIVLILASEVGHSDGVESAGLLPREVQGYVTFSAGIGAGSTARADAAKLIAALRAPATAHVYEEHGMELTR